MTLIKTTFQRSICILYIIIFFGCQKNKKIDGNYSICHNGEYTEVFFKEDSMRVASNTDKNYLSEWRKIELKNDTLHFETFGEWRDSTKVKIKSIGINKIELRILKSGKKLNLEPIKDNLKFDKLKEFWHGFNKRQSSSNCELIPIKH